MYTHCLQMVDTDTLSMGGAVCFLPSNGPTARWGDRRLGFARPGPGGVSSMLLESVELARSPTGRRLISVQGWGWGEGEME